MRAPPPRFYGVDERIELWGLQIPHNSVRPLLTDVVKLEGGDLQPGQQVRRLARTCMRMSHRVGPVANAAQ